MQHECRNARKRIRGWQRDPVRLSPEDQPPQRVAQNEQYRASQCPLTGQRSRAFTPLHLVSLAPEEGEAENDCNDDKAEHDPLHIASIGIPTSARQLTTGAPAAVVPR